jgi:dihydrofolate synthase/folylpolyglutamate synthase
VRTADEILTDLERSGIRLGLGNLRGLLGAMGNPERDLKAVLVAGTNGKGSTSALLAEIAAAAGYRVGHYTSPHLERVEERIRVDGRTIDPADLALLLNRIVESSERMHEEAPTYFEAMTVAAFLELKRRQVDLAVLEVGMGGRLDATNVVEPLLSIVTSIAFDHREWLGSTLGAIAREKAGIFRRSAPAVLSPQQPEADQALAEEAARRGTPVVAVGKRLRRLAIRGQGLDGLELELATETRGYVLRTALAGEHQAANVATALVAAEELAGHGFGEIDEEAITAGVERCRWPGRLESVVLPGGKGTVVLDAAHNPAGCEALARFLASLGRPYRLMFGALTDKELGAMLPPLAAGATDVVLTCPVSPRAADPAALAALVPVGMHLMIDPNPEIAFARALADEPPLLVACGSIYLVGALRRILRERFGVPPPIG